MARKLNIAMVLALLVALAAGLAASPASAERKRPPGKKAQHIKSQLQKRLETRGLENVDIRRCLIDERKVRGKTAVNCTWYAEGILPGPQPYRCHGDSLHGKLSTGRVGFIRISTCSNKAPVQIPVAPEPITRAPVRLQRRVAHRERLAPRHLRSAPAGLTRAPASSGRPSSPAAATYDWGDLRPALPEPDLARDHAAVDVCTAPCFAQENPCNCQNKTRPSPEFYDEMGDFAAAAVKRYPLIGGIEVWNEPNAGKYWGGQPEPDLYADMFKKVQETVEKADPDMPVLFGSLSPHAESDATTVAAAEFLAQGYDLGAVQMSDGISTHPYPGTGPGRGPRPAVLEAPRRPLGGDAPRARHRAAPVDHGGRASPPSAPAPSRPTSRPQALAQIYDAARRIPQIKTLIFHRFRDAQGDNEFEPGYGSVDNSGNAEAGLLRDRRHSRPHRLLRPPRLSRGCRGPRPASASSPGASWSAPCRGTCGCPCSDPSG